MDQDPGFSSIDLLASYCYPFAKRQRGRFLMIIEDFRCPVCGGPTRAQELPKRFWRERQVHYFCQDDRCGTILTQLYDEKSQSYSNLLYFADTKQVKSRVWGTYGCRNLTAEQWKTLIEGGTIKEAANMSFGGTIPGSGPLGVGLESGSITTTRGDFGTLISYGKFLKGFGAVLVILAVIVFFIGLAYPQVGFIVAIAGAIAFGVTGIGSMAPGEAIYCFVSIERNTRTTAELIKQLIK